MSSHTPHFDSLSREEREGLQWLIMQRVVLGVYDNVNPQNVYDRVERELEELAKNDELVTELRDAYEEYREVIGHNSRGLGDKGVQVMMSDKPAISDEMAASLPPNVYCRRVKLLDRLFPDNKSEPQR